MQTDSKRLEFPTVDAVSGCLSTVMRATGGSFAADAAVFEDDDRYGDEAGFPAVEGGRGFIARGEVGWNERRVSGLMDPRELDDV